MKKLLLVTLMAALSVMVASATIIDDFTAPNQFTCNPTQNLCPGPGSASESPRRYRIQHNQRQADDFDRGHGFR